MNTRTSKLIFPAILFLFASLIAFGENGPTPQTIVGSSGISDGSVTNAKLAEPVSVANGGTGKTTAAEALAALGGASLNGSSTVAFNASTINGVVPLTAAEKTQALVGSSTIDFEANLITFRAEKIPLSRNIVRAGNENAVAVDGTLSIATGLGAYNAGTLIVIDRSRGKAAKFFVYSGTVIEEQDPGSVFTITKDNATTINVYVTANELLIQNKHTTPLNIMASFIYTKD